MSSSELVDAGLEGALGRDGWRAQGLASWDDVAITGARNLRALRDWTQEAANRALIEEDREFLRAAQPVIARLIDLERSAVVDKPLLPRLRRESFRPGEAVVVYLGELRCETAGWARGEVVAIEKAFNPGWKSPEANSGYYWRLTARFATATVSRLSEVSFSTSEPRVIPEAEFHWLRKALVTDRKFVEIFAHNGRRDWQPLWCQEAGITVAAGDMDLLRWIEQG